MITIRINALTGQVLTSVDQNADREKLPTSFVFFQNYPNPFNPETVIQFNVKEPCQIILVVYNVLGQKISKLVNQQYKPGSYHVKFDATGLPSGVYFYQIKMGDYQAVRKMVVLE